MKFNDILNDIIERYNNKENGYYNCIPFSLERLSSVVPGIIPGEYYLVTGSSGSAKSKIARSLFIHDPYIYIKTHPELDIKFDVLYWSLEEDSYKVYSTEISRILKTKYNKNIGYRDLKSIGENSNLSKDDIELIKTIQNEYNDWEQHIHVFDSVKANPTGIMKRIEAFAYKIGRYYRKDGTPFTDEQMENVKKGTGEWINEISYYKTDHPRHYVIILIDHVSLLNPENGMNKTDTIYKLSTEYLLRAKNRYGFIPVIVQQQQSAKEKMQYTSAGSAIEEKVEPSLDGLADCTTTQREATIVFGIFAPARYRIENHNGYDITILQDNYRSLKILKQRDDKANIVLPLYFEGESDFFKTLPPADNKELMTKIYEKVILKRKK